MSHEHDPMELAEIADLKRRIRLLEDRLSAARDGSAPRDEADLAQMQDELDRIHAQLKRVEEIDWA